MNVTWNAISGASYYKLRYKVNGTPVWTAIPDKLYSTSYLITGLAPGVKYKIAVGAFCSNDKTSGYKNITATTGVVSVPTNLAAMAEGSDTLLVSWMPKCGTASFNLRYKKSSEVDWITVAGLVETGYTITGLLPETEYEVSVQASSGTATSAWSSSSYASTGADPTVPTDTRPNIIIYMLDDARYDPFQPNGGPDWFNTPAINRIADEGINFKYAFPTTSQCAPSRVSFYTGLYASHHGAVNNSTTRYDGLPMISKILQDAGYYTGFIGKYGQFQGDPEGFSWWATSTGDVFENAEYTINAVDTVINGHITDVYGNLAETFLESVPQGQKFLLYFNTRIPHSPTTPRDEDLDLYTGESMPFPDNFEQYAHNYPSYFYSQNGGHKWTKDESRTTESKLEEFQCLNGAEVNVEALLDWLTVHGILDSTLFIFTSDNGYLEGEHMLQAKQIAQEESIRIPMFMRYPAWFAPGTVNTNVLLSNIDIPLTLLDAAGIPDTFGMDGTSALKLLSGEVQRQFFYYQYVGDATTPAIRAVRSLQYKYVKHYCNELTEEFYDLETDPGENINQINNSAYGQLILSYRASLDSIMSSLGEEVPSNISCSLSNPQFERESESHAEANPQSFSIYPSPASGYFVVDFRDEMREDIQIWITDLLERPVYYKSLPYTNAFNLSVQSQDWKPGLYSIRVKKGAMIFSSQVVVQ